MNHRCSAPQIVEVCWLDTYGTHGWTPVAERNNGDRSGGMCRTIGYIIEDTDDYITLALSVSANGLVDCSNTIPKFAIVQRTLIREGVE